MAHAHGALPPNVDGTWRRGAQWRLDSDEGDSLASSSDDHDRNTLDEDDEDSRRFPAADDSLDGSGELDVHTPYWAAKRHLSCGNAGPPPAWMPNLGPWRAAPGKLKTANAALVLCMNIDVDPPDVVRPVRAAVLETWIDPHADASNKALERIGENLQAQFECLSPKIPYKPILDPTMEDFRRFCVSLRKQAKDDTVLLYYNGHGVPRPTANGELWCFNRTYTQYIPVGLADVQAWVGSPAVHIWDCSAAGHLLHAFRKAAQAKDDAHLHAKYREGEAPPPRHEASICMAACMAHETLPTAPELPADLFTACLTSPIDMALRWYALTHALPHQPLPVMLIPGDLKDRRTPLGELNWIFTAITDTIAWTTFPHDLFTRLYRSDLLIACLFRNFLLAERIMKEYDCTPLTHPRLPPTNTHALWASWDLAVDACLRQLPDMLPDLSEDELKAPPSAARKRAPGDPPPPPPKYRYTPSRFFTDQLTAFEVWLTRGGSALTKRGPRSLPEVAPPPPRKKGAAPRDTDDLVPRKPPEQLPIVLQVLLSQPHRLRALILLSQFVDLGPWAVHLALQIGIFPYISKLLQAAGQELRPVLIFIWARILAVDPSCQKDLYANHGYKYFANVLGNAEMPTHTIVPNRSEHKAMCAFILASIARDFAPGQNAVARERVFDHCMFLLDDGDFLVRQWAALCLAQLWAANDELKVYAVDNGVQDKLITMLHDDSPEVRAGVLYALSTFLGASGAPPDRPGAAGGGGTGSMPQLDERTHFRMEVAVVTGAALSVNMDASPMVRKELLVLASCLAHEWRGYFAICAWVYWEEARRGAGARADDAVAHAIADWLDGYGDDAGAREENRVLLSSFYTIYAALLELADDAYPEVRALAQTLVDYVTALLVESPFARLEGATIRDARRNLAGDAAAPRSRAISAGADGAGPPAAGPLRPSLSRADTGGLGGLTSGVSNTIRRTSSFANALKSLAGGIAFPTTAVAEDGRASLVSARGAKLADAAPAARAPSPNLNLATYTSPYPRPSASARARKAAEGGPLPPDEDEDVAVDFSPSDVMEALMEEDMERLRARRRAGAPVRGRAPAAPEPGADDLLSGLGTGTGICAALPLRSRFYEWCIEYFKEPQMRQSERDDAGSREYNYQMWRVQRNEAAVAQVAAQAPRAGRKRWDKHVKTMQMAGCPLHVALHAYDPHVFVANEADTISVWDWSKKRLLTTFSNGSTPGFAVSSLQVVNQWQGGMILAGSADGSAKLYRNYDPEGEAGPVQLVSAFRVLGEKTAMRRGAGLVLDWRQPGGTLLAGGDARVIKLWDAHTETALMDMDTHAEAPCGALASEGAGAGALFLAGFGDGGVRVLDRRMEEDDAVVRAYNAHTSWVQNVRWHPWHHGQFFTASLDGEVKLWDLRAREGALETWDQRSHGVSSMDVHSRAGVFATVSAVDHTHWRKQIVTVRNANRVEPLAEYALGTGLTAPPAHPWPSRWAPRSSSLVFHPTEMLYAVGQPNGSLRIFGCDLSPSESDTEVDPEVVESGAESE